MQRVTDMATAQRLMNEVENIDKPPKVNKNSTDAPAVEPPPELVFPLCGWYLQNDGEYATTFQVRELTGRDEEQIGKTSDPAKMLITMLERGLVAVGDEKRNADTLGNLLAGDWETVLLAIRRVTFGDEYRSRFWCGDCQQEGEVSIDLSELSMTEMSRSEKEFTVTGRHGIEYVVTPAYGSAQKLIMTANGKKATPAEMNTIMLKECVQTIGGRPVIVKDDITNIPLADRRMILKELDNHRCGPDLMGVMTTCPNCGSNQNLPLNVVAMFQG